MDRDLADPALGVGGVHFGIQLHYDALAERRHPFIVQSGVEFRQPGAALQRNQRQHRAHRELGLMHGARIGHRPQHVDRALARA